MWTFSSDRQERDVLLWTQGICCKQTAAFFFEISITLLYLQLQHGKLLNLMYTKVADFVPRKTFSETKNATDCTETDLNMGKSRGLAAADSGPNLKLVYTL